MKTIKSLSMLIALFIVGACSISEETPSTPSASAEIRTNLGGKTINIKTPKITIVFNEDASVITSFSIEDTVSSEENLDTLEGTTTSTTVSGSSITTSAKISLNILEGSTSNSATYRSAYTLNGVSYETVLTFTGITATGGTVRTTLNGRGENYFFTLP